VESYLKVSRGYGYNFIIFGAMALLELGMSFSVLRFGKRSLAGCDVLLCS